MPSSLFPRSRLIRLVRVLITGSAALLLSPAQAAEAPVLHYQGQTYQQQTLPAPVKVGLHELAQQHNQQRQQVFDTYVVNRYVQEESERQGKSFQQLQQELLSAPMPTQLQIETFYNANQARIQGSLQQVQDEITKHLNNLALQQKQRELLSRIANEKGYRVELPQLPTLRLPIKLDGFPSKGNPEAKVTLVEFADFQCPHCKSVGPEVKKILQKYGEQVRLVFRDFPINQSGISTKVAEAAVCADQQKMYWPFHDLAFARQSYLKSVTPQMLAEELELDMAVFNACLKSGKAQAQVAASKAEARELGVSSTPSFFVNGRPMSHSHEDLVTELSAMIDQELKGN